MYNETEGGSANLKDNSLKRESLREQHLIKDVLETYKNSALSTPLLEPQIFKDEMSFAGQGHDGHL